jgi:hypothetical protein
MPSVLSKETMFFIVGIGSICAACILAVSAPMVASAIITTVSGPCMYYLHNTETRSPSDSGSKKH